MSTKLHIISTATKAALLVAAPLLIVSCLDEHGKPTAFTFILGGVIAFFIIMGAIIIYVFRTQYKHQKDIEKVVAERKDFTESKVIKEKGYYYLATDEGRKKVFYALGNELVLLFDYADVVSVEVKIDGATSVWKKSLAGSFAGAVAGGALIGGQYGSILGALAAGNSTQRRINTIVVHVLLRNQPTQSIEFRCDTGAELNEPDITYYNRYKKTTTRAQELYDLFRLIIDTADRDRKLTENKSVIQDLKELSELHEKGGVTDEEYTILKQKLIKD